VKTPLILSFQFMTDHTFLQILENDSGLTDIPATHDWLKENKKSIELKLEEHGAILFKDLPTETAEDFDQFVSTFNYETFTYEESLSNAVRINKTSKVFTANEAQGKLRFSFTMKWHKLPATQRIFSFFVNLLQKLVEKLLYVDLINYTRHY